MPKVDTTVGNYTVQMPAYLWNFLNERAQKLNYMTGTYLSSIIFQELQNPATPREVFHLVLRERLYPLYEEKSIQHIIDVIDDETQQIVDLLPDEDDDDTPQ